MMKGIWIPFQDENSFVQLELFIPGFQFQMKIPGLVYSIPKLVAGPGHGVTDSDLPRRLPATSSW